MNWMMKLATAALPIGIAFSTTTLALAAPPANEAAGAAVAPILVQSEGDPVTASFVRLLTAGPSTAGELATRYSSSVDPLKRMMDALLADAERWHHLPAQAETPRSGLSILDLQREGDALAASFVRGLTAS